MKATWLIFVTLVAGIVSGSFLGIINLAIAEPLIDRAIGFEVQSEIQSGHHVDYSQLSDYRAWQKNGEIVSAIILGIALSSVLGIAFAYSRNRLPGSSYIKKAVILAGTIWFVLFFVTSLKYPPNPPAVDAPDTSLYFRQVLYVAFLSVSGLAALGSVVISKKLDCKIKPWISIPLIYLAIASCAYIALPPNGYQVPDEMKNLVLDFRIVSGLSMGLFWGVMGLTFGLLWEKFRPKLESDQRLTTA